jgi:tetratricopeptide (TPR) repeat protein
VFVAEAIGVARSRPLEAAKLFEKAASLVPISSDRSGRFLSNYRAALLLSASRAADVASRIAYIDKVQAATLVVRAHQQVCALLDSNPADIPTDAVLAFSRALTLLGRASEAEAAIAALSAELRANPFVLYELAAVKSAKNDLDQAFSLLRESFQQHPRLDRNVLRDESLRNLLLSRNEDVHLLCAPDIVGGMWIASESRSIAFYPDGTVRQVDLGQPVTGTFELRPSNQLVLQGPTRQTTVDYRVAGDQLTLAGETYRRVRNPMFGSHSIDGASFTINHDGTWSQETRFGTATGHWAACSSAKSLEAELWYTWEDPLMGRRHFIRRVDTAR